MRSWRGPPVSTKSRFCSGREPTASGANRSRSSPETWLTAWLRSEPVADADGRDLRLEEVLIQRGESAALNVVLQGEVVEDVGDQSIAKAVDRSRPPVA